MDVTGKTAAEVEDAIMEQLKGYKLTINGREDLSESITGEEVGLYAEFDDTLAKAIAAQKPMEWGKYRFGKSVNEVNTDALIRYNDEMLGEAVDSLSCMDKENMREPQDAKISDYTSGGYTIIKEDEGTELLEDQGERGGGRCGHVSGGERGSGGTGMLCVSVHHFRGRGVKDGL